MSSEKLSDQDESRCIETLQKELKERQGGKLDIVLALNMQGGWTFPNMRVLRCDNDKPETRRDKACRVLPNYCPFCGIAYKGRGKPSAQL